MPNLSVQDWEKRYPGIEWRGPVRIVITAALGDPLAPEFPVAAAPGQPHPDGLFACRVCIANYGFRAAYWREDGRAFETKAGWDRHMADQHGIEP